MATPSVLAIPTFEPESGQFTATVPDSTKQQPSLWGFPEWFAVAQVAGPALLYLPGSQAFRVPLRAGVFALSLTGLVWCLRSSRFARVHPSWTLLVSAAVYMAVMILHPGHQHHDGRPGADRNAPCRCGAVILGALLLSGRLQTPGSCADNPLGS